MRYLFTALIIISSLLSLSQKKNMDLGSLANVNVELPETPNKGAEKLKVGSVYVVDARPDTSTIGYWKSKLGYTFSRIKIADCAGQVRRFINNHYARQSDSAAYRILIVIKRIWISQLDSAIRTNVKFISKTKYRHTAINLKLECYLQNGTEFYPISRSDTVQIFRREDLFGNDTGESLGLAIITATRRALHMEPEKIIQIRKCLSFQQIKQTLDKVTNVPILTDSLFPKGVYTTFADFIMNKPSYDYVGKEEKKYGDVLFVRDSNGKEYSSNHFWGFSDGKSLFISTGRNFFPLVRTGNTFTFHGTKNIERTLHRVSISNERIGSPTFLYNETLMNYSIYQLDMEKGTAY